MTEQTQRVREKLAEAMRVTVLTSAGILAA
jgi:hypothetical protein